MTFETVRLQSGQHWKWNKSNKLGRYAQACKNFRAEWRRDVPANSTFSGPITDLLSVKLNENFDENPFTCQCEKKTKKKKEEEKDEKA